jgi:hypothetical protein
MNHINPALYADAVSNLQGGKGGKRRKSKTTGTGSRSRSRKHAQKKQRGGLFPGLGGIIQQALIPFGLYALQHSMKKRSGNKKSVYTSSSSDSASPPSFRKFTRRR